MVKEQSTILSSCNCDMGHTKASINMCNALNHTEIIIFYFFLLPHLAWFVLIRFCVQLHKRNVTAKVKNNKFLANTLHKFNQRDEEKKIVE